MDDLSPHVLLVDDDRRIRALLSSYLQGNGFRVTAAAQAAEARQALQSLSFDLMVLDVMMPGENGFSFAQSLRSAGVTMPILMLSARTDATDRIQGLTSGSDDYLGKPFEPEELLLRLRSLLKRAAPRAAKLRQVRFGDFLFDLESGQLEERGTIVHITGREKDILRLLAQARGQTVARAALQSEGIAEEARAIDVQMTRLRQKIEKDPARPIYLQTVRGQGYCLIADAMDMT